MLTATKHRHIPSHFLYISGSNWYCPLCWCIVENAFPRLAEEGTEQLKYSPSIKKCVEDWKRKAAIPQKIEGKKRRTFDKNCSKLFLPSPLKWYNNAMVIATQERCWKNKGSKDFLRKPKLIPFVMENGKPFICSKPFMCLLYRPPLLPLPKEQCSNLADFFVF